jgi:hypothetical protein
MGAWLIPGGANAGITPLDTQPFYNRPPALLNFVLHGDAHSCLHLYEVTIENISASTSRLIRDKRRAHSRSSFCTAAWGYSVSVQEPATTNRKTK